MLLSNVRNRTERQSEIYQEIGKHAEEPEIKEAIEARAFVSKQILAKLDECFRIIGEKPGQSTGQLQETFQTQRRPKMKFWNKAFRVVTFAAVALLLACESAAQQHPRYGLVDLGTFGGPHSYGSVNGDGFQLLNNSGAVAFSAELNAPDPNQSFFCFNPDCFQTHAAYWKDGELTDVGALPQDNNSAAGSINARGWMTGQSQSSTIDPSLGWKKERSIIDLGLLPGGTESLGIYVNDSGQVIGFSDNGIPDPFSFPFFFTGTQIHTFIWDNGAMRDIGTLGGPDAVPSASCSGQPHDVVIGSSFLSNSPNQLTGFPTFDPFRWKNGTMTDLGGLGGTIGFGQCTNSAGQIIGQSDLSGDAVAHAFLWDDGAMTDLGTLGGDNSEAIWINNAGEIVGSADLPGPSGSQAHDAVVWINGKIQDLGTVQGDACSRGRGINARGQLVGGSSDCFNFLHAFVWENGGPMQDLNTLIAPGSGWQLTNAFNINDRGEILAKAAPVGFTPEDDADLGHLVLLVPCQSIDEGGCGGNAQSAATVKVVPKLGPSRMRPLKGAAWGAKLGPRYHLPVKR